MTKNDLILVEIAYALPSRQQIIKLQVPAETTAFEAVNKSGIVAQFPDINLEKVQMGIYGKMLGAKGLKKPKEYVLKNMDRVEIYRPLTIDPKEIRRRRAKKSCD